MYIPKHFKVGDEDRLERRLTASLFGQLTSIVDGSPTVTHLPFAYRPEDRTLLSHMARANPHWQSIHQNEVLVVLPGPHDYISPSWYEGAGVPTWNYQATHVYGRATVFDDAQRLKELVIELTDKEEARFSQPWQADFPASMLRGIVGIQIEITRIEAKDKLSQNRSPADQREVIRQLERSNPRLAAAMREVNKLDNES